MIYNPKISCKYKWLTKIAKNYLETGKLLLSKKQLEQLGIRCQWLSDKNSLEIDKIMLDGARKSAKSLSLYVFFCIILMFAPLDKNTTIKVYAWYYKDAYQCFDEFKKRAKDFGVDFNKKPYCDMVNIKNLKIKFEWTYWDEINKKNIDICNEILFTSCYELQKINKLGATRSSDFWLEIVMFEEYSKIKEPDTLEFIRQSHGGSQKYLECFSSNPWSVKHFLIKEAHSKLIYNLEEIKKYHYQMMVDKEGAIFWHCQWRVNDLISPPDIKKQEKIEKNNVVLAKIACFGMPGVEGGGILTSHYNLIKYIDIHSIEDLVKWDESFSLDNGYYQIGMDFATKQDKSVLQLVRFSGMQEVNGEIIFDKVIIVKEWFWDEVCLGEDYSYRADDMAEYIYNNIILEMAKLLPNFKKQIYNFELNFYIDVSAIIMIAAIKKCLNKYWNNPICQNINVKESLRFNTKKIGNAKFYTKDLPKIYEIRRILENDAFYVLRYDDESACPLLEDNILNWEYKKSIQGIEKDIPSDKNCDAIDAFIYSICDVYGAIGGYFQK